MIETSFETEYSHAFIRGALPHGGRRVLEVGCGDGALAARLLADGLSVLALDTAAEAVASARRRGVDARVVAWPAAPGDSFDAVLFTRSLHHIPALAESIDAAMACLAPGGRIVLEDFALEAVDARTLRWFADALQPLAARGQLVRSDDLIDALLDTGGSLEVWRAAHDHDLHSATAMRAALSARCATVREQRVPYLFRYLTEALEEGARRNVIMRAVERQEQAAILDGAIAEIGWRFVGRRRD